MKKTTLLITLFLTILSTNVFSQEAIIPNNRDASQGDNIHFMFAGDRTYQILINKNQLQDHINQSILGFTLRLKSNVSNDWPSTDAYYSNFDIYIGTAINELSATSLTFSNNFVGEKTLVRSGELQIPSESFPKGSIDNFGIMIPFDIPFNYTGENLILELRYKANEITGASVDGISNYHTDYKNKISCIWINSYTGTRANVFSSAPVIKLFFEEEEVSSVDYLGTNTVKLYPNPIVDILTISDNEPIKQIDIYNTLGQKVLSEKFNNKEVQLDLSELNSGVFIVQIKTDSSVQKTKITKK